MAWHLITSLLSQCSSLLPSIRASELSCSSSSSSSNSTSERGRAFKEDLERLMRTLERIKATLYDAEEREIRDRSIKLWLKELQRVAYDAEDVLSMYRYEATRVQVEARKASEASGSHKRKQMEYIVPVPDDMVERLNKIRKRFDEIVKDREALRLSESEGARRPNNKILRPPTGHMVDETSIFGRDMEVMEVIDLLLSEKEKTFSVISIIGKGGLGKTTIAQLVYKDATVRQCFSLFGWVCISEDFNVERIIKATIESVTRHSCSLCELSPLQEELANTVKGERILLVLDDIWNENQSLWELFRIAFKEAQLVRILATTRNDKVAEVMQTTACFRPNYLPENFCWQLFQHYAFDGVSHTVPPYFVEMGRKIMRKCGGLPLAVKSIASLLRHETDEESWREILESDIWESNLSIDIFPALQISYIHLPTHIKPCFLLCSMYPKDYGIPKDNLIELWISHGYIRSVGKRTVREVGAEYYKELRERSLLDDVLYRLPESCKLHDIIHDLARLNSEKEHFSVEINQTHDIQEVNIPQEVNHLYVGGSVRYVNKVLQQNLKGLRTLSTDLQGCRGNSEHKHCINSTENMDLNLMLMECDVFFMGNTTIFNLTRFEALRVLELKGDCLREIPDCISQLKHLSYLRVTSNHLQMLPFSIGLLYNLQTFILDCYKSPLKYLPESIGYLANLRYLYIKCELEELPRSLCLLTNLLRLIIKSTCLVKIPSDIGKLSNLEELTISSNRIGALRHSFQIQELPTAIGNLQKLKTLKIHNRLFNYNSHILKNFPAMRTMAACLSVRTIAWLKDMKDLEGKLIIEGLENMSNLVDAQHANLRSKCKIETLNLFWHNLCEHEHYDGWYKEELTIRLIKEPEEGRVVGGDMNFGLLKCLQPHPHLKKLLLRGYPPATVPNWMEDPFSLQSIESITLSNCHNLQSLPFRNLHTLKHLQVESCSGIRLLQLEQLHSQLENLEIFLCKELELITGLRNLDMLAALQIFTCEALKSITMDELQFVESTECPGNSSHEKPHDGWQSTSSLKRLHIWNCPLLHVQPHELVKSGRCNVWVLHCGCPDLCEPGTYTFIDEDFW